ncbi:MAG: glycosyltransferase family 2 protein [Thermoguttaceae bacterium]
MDDVLKDCLPIADSQRICPGEIEISIVVPSFNEELSLTAFYEAVSAQLNEMGCTWEMVFVNDGSKDQTGAVLQSLHERDQRVKVVQFARNFGNQIAISAGLEHSSGEAVIIMDADLQQPPEMIPEMVRLWKSGYAVINTVRTYGKEIGWRKRTTSSLFYWVMNSLSDVQIIPNSSDFRLLDRRVVDALIQMPEKMRFLRAMISWLGFRQIVLPFESAPRYAGVPSFSTGKLIALAIDGITGFSVRPLRWIMYLGFVTAFSIVPYIGWAFFQYLFLGGSPTPGWASLIVTILFLGGVQLISLGVIGEYIGRIFREVKGRPLYIVQEKLGFVQSVQNPAQQVVTPFETDQQRFRVA